MDGGGAFGEGPRDLAGFAQSAIGGGGKGHAAFLGVEDFGLRAAFEEERLLALMGGAPLFETSSGGLEALAGGGLGIGEREFTGEGGGEREFEGVADRGAGVIEFGGHRGCGA